MKKKALAVLSVLLCIVMVLPACAPNSPSTSSEQPEATAAIAVPEAPASTPAAQSEQKFTIATINKMDGIPWFTRTQQGVEEFASEHLNVTAFIQAPPKVDAALQSQMLQDAITQKVNAICVTPFQPEPLEPILKQAMEAGIVVVSHEAANQQNVNFDIEPFNNKDFGEHLMQELAKNMGEEGEYVVFVASLTSKTHNEWADAAIAYQKEHYPNMTLVGDKVETYDDSQQAYDRMKEVMAKYPNLKGVQGSAATDVVGAGQAVEEVGMQDKISVVGVSLPSMVGELLETGAVDLASCWDPALSGKAMNIIALTILEGNGDKIGEGYDLGIPGYNVLKKDGHVLYGQAWQDFVKDNYKQFAF